MIYFIKQNSQKKIIYIFENIYLFKYNLSWNIYFDYKKKILINFNFQLLFFIINLKCFTDNHDLFFEIVILFENCFKFNCTNK